VKHVRRHGAGDLPPEAAAWLSRHTLLGSVEFASLWETVGGKPVLWTVYDDDRPIALIPGVQFGRGRLARFQAMPDGLYSRLQCLDGSVDRNQAAQLVMERIASEGYARVFINDYYCQCGDCPGFERRECSTRLVDVSRDDWHPLNPTLRSEIRKALREGTPTRDFSLNRHFDSFLELMSRTEKRHGRQPKYPLAFYRALGKVAMVDSRVRWIVCEQGDRLAASHIYFIENEMLLNWQIFFDKEFSALKPNQVITFSLTHELALRGVKVLNLGSSPEMAVSLADYKAKWGGEMYSYPWFVRESWIGKLL
jgi:hypothetical protein